MSDLDKMICRQSILPEQVPAMCAVKVGYVIFSSDKHLLEIKLLYQAWMSSMDIKHRRQAETRETYCKCSS